MRRFGIPTRVRGLLHAARSGITRRLIRLQQALTPAPATARWIGRAGLAGALIFGAWQGAEGLHLGFGPLVDGLGGALIALVIYGALRLALPLALGLARGLRMHLGVAGLAALLAWMMLWQMYGLSPGPAALAGAVAGLSACGVGMMLALASRRPLGAALAGVPSLVVLVGAIAWLLLARPLDDPTTELVRMPGHDGGEHARYLDPGAHQVAALTYGSGDDRLRRAYGADVAWTSDPVDGRELLGRPSGWRIDLRERWWGFGLDALPVNGRVWYPEDAPGPLPLVLVVHGNHNMMHFSDPGYAWLGEHLASRGHVVVSVDENFLNGGLLGGLGRENAARAWMLLEHLRAWRQWSGAPSHPLHRRVDPERAVLIGHSRGGEAVVLAAAFNDLERLPDNASVALDYGFDIRGVAAIAPIDGQYRPADRSVPVRKVNYFTIQGGHDADVSSFFGDRVYARARPPTGGLKASVYMHHANHGQFNTVWGDSDAGGATRHILNRRALMPGSAQRRAALLYLTAFVEHSLAADDAWPGAFCDARAAGRLLPETLYVNRCNDGRRRVLADFDEDLDVHTGSRPGIRLSAEDFARFDEGDVGFRSGTRRRQTGVWLGWHADEDAPDPVYTVDFADAAPPAGPGAVLWLDLAQADRDPPRPLDGEDDKSGETDRDADGNDRDLRPPVRVQVEIEDRSGRRARRPLSDFAELLPPLPVRHTRLEFLDRERYRRPTEPVLQSVAIPLDAFAGDGESPDLTDLRRIRLQFDADDPGMVVIEEIGLEPAD